MDHAHSQTLDLASTEVVELSFAEADGLQRHGQSAIARRRRAPLFSRLRTASAVNLLPRSGVISNMPVNTGASEFPTLVRKEVSRSSAALNVSRAFPSTNVHAVRTGTQVDEPLPPYTRQRTLSAAEEIAEDYRSRNIVGVFSEPSSPTEYSMNLSRSAFTHPQSRQIQPLQATIPSIAPQVVSWEGAGSYKNKALVASNETVIENSQASDFPLEPSQTANQRWSTAPSIDSNIAAALRFAAGELRTEHRASGFSTNSGPIYGLHSTTSSKSPNIAVASTATIPSEEPQYTKISESSKKGPEYIYNSTMDEKQLQLGETPSDNFVVVKVGDQDVTLTTTASSLSHIAGGTRTKMTPSITADLARAGKEALIIADRAAETNENLRCDRPECNAVLANEKALKYHLHVHMIQERMFSCPKCQKEFETTRELNMHVCKVPPKISRPVTPKSLKRSKSPQPQAPKSPLFSPTRRVFNHSTIMCCVHGGSIEN